MSLLTSRVEPADFSWVATSGPAEEVRRIVAAATSADFRSPLNEAAVLSLRHHGLAASTLVLAKFAELSELPGSGSVLPPSPRGNSVGFALVSRDEVNLVVHPDHRGQGVGARLAWDVLGQHGGQPLSAWSHGNHPAASALAASTGFERVRDLWVMRRSLREALNELPDAAEGIVVRPFRRGEDEEAFLALNAEAFAHHPEQGNLSLADLHQREDEPWFDAAGFFLAVRGEELLGFHWTKVHDDADPAYGEVYVVGVSPAAQGMGLGKLLTLTGLHHLRDRRLAEVILYVEADNAAAVAVYAGLGFTHADADTDVMYTRA